MADISIRKVGKCGRITLQRPKALNALTYSMCLDIEAALDGWATDDDVAMVVIDAEGDKAFSAGGDIQMMYDTAAQGDFRYGRKFWHDEYRMNAKVFNFPKPYAAFMQGFTMGGGVGVSCHGSHRVVCENSQIAMPETGIGLIPDIGGSLMLARAPGRLGEYLGTTGGRMDAGNAIYAGFADYYIARENWAAVITRLEDTGNWDAIDRAAEPAPAPTYQDMQADIDRHFGGETIGDVLRSLKTDDSEFSARTQKTLAQKSPLSVACTIEIVHRVRGADTIEAALREEFRFTFRSASDGDFIEGIRAVIIDKDNTPRFKHPSLDAVKDLEVTEMLMPLAAEALKDLEENP
ncbi:MAG: enoyl-CoA hydratase/isomerase family protein [Rhodobacteraceae bacterium]|nr:enoyl-CoA hydratase/isomerase family protein [Paracoccaceae bacterium]